MLKRKSQIVEQIEQAKNDLEGLIGLLINAITDALDSNNIDLKSIYSIEKINTLLKILSNIYFDEYQELADLKNAITQLQEVHRTEYKDLAQLKSFANAFTEVVIRLQGTLKLENYLQDPSLEPETRVDRNNSAMTIGESWRNSDNLAEFMVSSVSSLRRSVRHNSSSSSNPESKIRMLIALTAQLVEMMEAKETEKNQREKRKSARLIFNDEKKNEKDTLSRLLIGLEGATTKAKERPHSMNSVGTANRQKEVVVHQISLWQHAKRQTFFAKDPKTFPFLAYHREIYPKRAFTL